MNQGGVRRRTLARLTHCKCLKSIVAAAAAADDEVVDTGWMRKYLSFSLVSTILPSRYLHRIAFDVEQALVCGVAAAAVVDDVDDGVGMGARMPPG